MTSYTRAAMLSFILAVAAAAAEKGAGLPKNSPFMPVNTVAAAPEAAHERVEFAGVSSVGKKIDLIFYDKTAKKSQWIGVGETKDGIAVLSYDDQREQAVVKINGVEKALSLRKGARPAAGPRPVAPLPAPAGFSIPIPATLPATEVVQKFQALPDVTTAAPAPFPPTNAMPVAPEVQAQMKAETEARMLVSDLLEIGMAQRKAYEEAQKKAAEGAPQNPPSPEVPKPQ